MSGLADDCAALRNLNCWIRLRRRASENCCEQDESEYLEKRRANVIWSGIDILNLPFLFGVSVALGSGREQLTSVEGNAELLA